MMAYQDWFGGWQSGTVQLRGYFQPPEVLEPERIQAADRSAARLLAGARQLVEDLAAYRQALAERYAALSVMPYRDRLELERRPDSWRGKIYYYVRIVRTYEDGTKVNLISESFPGADRSKALTRFQALQKERPGIEAVKDIARRAWEK